MKKFLSKLNFIFAIASFAVCNLILLFAGTIDYDYKRVACFGTGCYTAGGSHSRLYFTMLSGMGIDDDALALSIMLFIMLIATFVMFMVELFANKKGKLNPLSRVIYYAIFGTLLMTFTIYNAINASNSSDVGGDVIAPFAFIWMFATFGVIVVNAIFNPKIKKNS